MYKLEMIAGSTAHPTPKDRDQCRDVMFKGLSTICGAFIINDPLRNGGLNMHGIVTTTLSLDDALLWTIDLSPYDPNFVAAIYFYFTDDDGTQYAAFWEDGHFIIYRGEDEEPHAVDIKEIQ